MNFIDLMNVLYGWKCFHGHVGG